MATSICSKRSGDSAFKINFSMTFTGEYETISKPIYIDNLAMLKFKGSANLSEDKMKVTISFTSSKLILAKDKIIKINVDSKQLKYSAMNIDVQNKWSEWQEIGCIPTYEKDIAKLYYKSISISVTLYEDKKETVLTKLHTDSDFIDFHLATTEGSVPVHRACLATHSDVFKAMLTNEWKETAEGQIKIKGVTIETLQQLKDYMYLGTVPDVGLRSLLLIARFYLIEDLEKHCIRKLAQAVTGQELYSLLEFACENNIPELAFAMLVITQDSVVNEAKTNKKVATLETKKQVECQQ